MSRTRYNVLVVFLLTVFSVTSFAQTTGNQVAKGPTPKATAPTTSKTAKTPIDLNTASKQVLMGLPGMNEASAQKIIENRPYRAKSDLTQKKVLSADAYAKIAEMVVARTTTRVTAGNVERKAATSKGTSEVKKQYQ